METELVAVFTVMAVAAVAAAVTIDRRMDVLYGPYIEGCTSEETVLQKVATLTSSRVDHLRWKARNAIYLTSIVAG